MLITLALYVLAAAIGGHARILSRAGPSAPNLGLLDLAQEAAGRALEVLPLQETLLEPLSPQDSNLSGLFKWLSEVTKGDKVTVEDLSAEEEARIFRTALPLHTDIDRLNIPHRASNSTPELSLSEKADIIDKLLQHNRSDLITPETLTAELGKDFVSAAAIGLPLFEAAFASIIAELAVTVVFPTLLVASVVALPLILWDLIAESVPYHFGTCDMKTNHCIADSDQKQYQCQYSYPCKKQGDVCGYRSVKPANVVCDWNLYRYWIHTAQLSPLTSAWRAQKAEHHQKKYEKYAARLDKIKEAEAKCKKNWCRGMYEAGTKETEAKLEHEATRRDMMKDVRREKEATKLWQKTIAITNDLKASIKKYNDTWKEIDTARFAGNPMTEDFLKNLEKTFTDTENDIVKHNQDLMTTLGHAKESTVGADPIGVGKLLVQNLYGNLTDEKSRNITAAIFNMTGLDEGGRV